LQSDCFSTAGVTTKTTHHEKKQAGNEHFRGQIQYFHGEGVTGIIKTVTPEILAMPESTNYTKVSFQSVCLYFFFTDVIKNCSHPSLS